MKQNITLSIAATTLAAILTFTSCSKTEGFNNPALPESRLQTNALTASDYSSDRVDAIVKDLSIDNYSFSFAKASPAAGITRTAYGSDNYLMFADPQDMICPEPIRIKFAKGIPIYKRPNFIVPTCPDMAIDIHKLGEMQDLIVKANLGGLKQIQTYGGGGFLASQETFRAFASLKTDKLDDMLGDFSGAKFLLLGAPDASNGGVFTRGFYGYANLNEIVFKQYKTNLKDLLKPTLKGCFDPLILKGIRERLIAVNPAIYKGLEVTTLPQSRNIAILN